MRLTCYKCGEMKELSEFYNSKRNTNRNNKSSYCIPCDKLRRLEYVRKNPEKARAYSTQYSRKNRAFFPDGLFELRLEEQGNRCAICNSDTPGGTGQFHADHDHLTQTPRGALCFYCNSALGFFKDNIEIMQAAIDYINKYTKE